MLPEIYIDADVRNVTPLCPVRQRLGLGLKLADGQILRLALSLKDAQFIQASLADYLDGLTGSQYCGSALIPSDPMSVPSDGGNV